MAVICVVDLEDLGHVTKLRTVFMNQSNQYVDARCSALNENAITSLETQ